MTRKIPVVYENGVFRPLQKVDIEENVKLDIMIDANEDVTEDDPNKPLMDILDNPSRMGKILFRNRKELYDDTP